MVGEIGHGLTNWETQVMKFDLKGHPVTLVGDPTLVQSKI